MPFEGSVPCKVSEEIMLHSLKRQKMMMFLKIVYHKLSPCASELMSKAGSKLELLIQLVTALSLCCNPLSRAPGCAFQIQAFDQHT
jgi:hypothetical protein